MSCVEVFSQSLDSRDLREEKEKRTHSFSKTVGDYPQRLTIKILLVHGINLICKLKCDLICHYISARSELS